MLSFGENILKIGPVDPEIIVLRAIIKKKEINASKIYSPSSKFADWAKLTTGNTCVSVIACRFT